MEINVLDSNCNRTCPIGCFWMCEDSDDEKPLSSKYNSKSKVGSSNNHKPVVPKVHQNGSASKDNTQLKNIGLNKRPPDEERSASVKKPKLSDTVTLVNHKPTRLQAQAAGVAYSHPMTNLTSRMAVFGPNMEGFGRLWRGTNADLALAIPTVGIYLPCYDIFRNWFEEFAAENAPSMTPYAPLLVGTMAGGAADCQFWHRNLGIKCRLHELANKSRDSVTGASKMLANILYSYRGMDSEGGRLKGLTNHLLSRHRHIEGLTSKHQQYWCQGLP
uniref:Uncharacterized protein n=1 Tax=Lactuca sativa TaxID=4236 RepID=A0A9R1V154_LACSA|nr:hypothetical protein LSAT_V11C700358720 [Lactuca sativa]